MRGITFGGGNDNKNIEVYFNNSIRTVETRIYVMCSLNHSN